MLLISNVWWCGVVCVCACECANGYLLYQVCQQCLETLPHAWTLCSEKQSYTMIWTVVVTGWAGNRHFTLTQIIP